ncbi:MAG: hypothetical protein OEV92_01200 [Nitrospinota bacterium]|nr:hypothetical protein [Nitrospinota bacterium]
MITTSPTLVATINVTPTADAVGVDGFCSLRESVFGPSAKNQRGRKC